MSILKPIHPGEILAEEFMVPLGLSANALARAVEVPVTRISEIIRGRRGVSADTALRLARFFGTSAELWLGLQNEFDLRVARREVGEKIRTRIRAPRQVARGVYRPVLGSPARALEEVREPPLQYGAGGRSEKPGRRQAGASRKAK